MEGFEQFVNFSYMIFGQKRLIIIIIIFISDISYVLPPEVD